MVRFPDGLDVVRGEWFQGSDVEKVIIPNSVTSLGHYAFYQCTQLREVVFEPNSSLRTIGSHCFVRCQLREIFIPKSLRAIGEMAFYGCKNLSSLRFEDGSELSYVGF